MNGDIDTSDLECIQLTPAGVAVVKLLEEMDEIKAKLAAAEVTAQAQADCLLDQARAVHVACCRAEAAEARVKELEWHIAKLHTGEALDEANRAGYGYGAATERAAIVAYAKKRGEDVRSMDGLPPESVAYFAAYRAGLIDFWKGVERGAHLAAGAGKEGGDVR